jgi:hypothetical protein
MHLTCPDDVYCRGTHSHRKLSSVGEVGWMLSSLSLSCTRAAVYVDNTNVWNQHGNLTATFLQGTGVCLLFSTYDVSSLACTHGPQLTPHMPVCSYQYLLQGHMGATGRCFHRLQRLYRYVGQDFVRMVAGPSHFLAATGISVNSQFNWTQIGDVSITVMGVGAVGMFCSLFHCLALSGPLNVCPVVVGWLWGGRNQRFQWQLGTERHS